MTSAEKHPHVGHRSTMLHHRFPNGFTEIFMDETDREVSTLTDRAFRSLCVGDEAVYNDEVSHGYSPFSCYKPLVGDPTKNTKDVGKNRHVNSGQYAQGMSGVSILKAFGATEENCRGLLIKNGDGHDNNEGSWDKSALLSIERELREFSSDFKNPTAEEAGVDKNMSAKTKNGKSTIKLQRLNVRNFFLHSEFSPFQSWRDYNRPPFSQENITAYLPAVDEAPKWYDSPSYKELTDPHRIENLHVEGTNRQTPVKPPPPPPPPRPRRPPKVLPKPLASEKRCASYTSSHGETTAPWRRNRARAQSTVPVNPTGFICRPIETPKLAGECPLSYKKACEGISKPVKVCAGETEEPCSSTPFSISQLMTPVIPSRQATDTSDMLSLVLSPSLLDLPFLGLEPGSPVKPRSTPEVVRRESYKSIASSLLFNLKDNRKRVKSRYSPPKFRTEQADRSAPSPKLPERRLTSDGAASGFGTPAILASGFNTPASQVDGHLPINSPSAESHNAGVGKYLDSDLSDNYLISSLLQTNQERRNGDRQKHDTSERSTLRNDEVGTEESQSDAPVIKPEVPPRSKKGNAKKEESAENEKGPVNVMAVSVEDIRNKECLGRGSKNDEMEERGTVSNRETFDAKVKAERQTNALGSARVEQEKCIGNVTEELVQSIAEKMSPLLNGSNVNPSQQDYNSVSSKSSYFSVEGSIHKNVETESNAYHSLENLIAELDEVDDSVGDVQRRTLLDYYSVSEIENEDVTAEPVVSPEQDSDISLKEDKEFTVNKMDLRGWVPQSTMDSTNNPPSTSQSNVFSPALGKPSLFKVKDNTFSHHVLPVTKTVKPVLHKTNHDPGQHAPWSPRGSVSGSEKSEDDHHDRLKVSNEIPFASHVAKTPEKTVNPEETRCSRSPLPLLRLNPEHTKNHPCAPWSPRESLTSSEKGEEGRVEIHKPHEAVLTPDKPKETVQRFPLPTSKLSQDNSTKGQQNGCLLTVPQEDNTHPGCSPSSGGTVDTAYDTPEGPEVPSERSGSACSGNDTQGPGRPPVVPPKSEKALLKAMKLTSRRIRKEEEKTQPHKSISGSKSRSSRSYSKRKSSEQKSSKTNSGDKPSSGEKQHLEQTECSSRRGDKYSHVKSEHQVCSKEKHQHSDSDLLAHNREKLHSLVPKHRSPASEKPSKGTEHGSRCGEKLKNSEPELRGCNRDEPNHGKSERQGRSNEQHGREKPDKRFLSSDRALSEYKRQNSEISTSERMPRHRAQSMDRHIGDKAEIKMDSHEGSSTNRAEPRSERIEKSIRHELSQRGRALERSHREKADNRNHSVDSYASEIIDLTSPQPNLSRQSSYTSQYSHQSSLEHGYASFPMTQRKLLQDPDSGQYFVFDMPVQVTTKTFFDPETGNYVQLPVQPPEDPVPQASTVDMMNAPRVIYHGSFVPVTVSSIPSQNPVVHASQLDQDQYKQRLEKLWYNHNNDGHPYLEPVYGSQGHTLGEFVGTEEHYDHMS
ncbi:hypothetical protein DPEC_G00328790 [Dallia pectoralis]|uniref:Uncharacterized protein n=1 Tax=Dallia pectoralis TaxID=75939 RepID=A0ACC2F8K1_DALPE|nr:hypothetical protein DPEC_G00328790 [Dallia pectoralis]